MSVPRHHAEWLSLLETSGPFVSMPVLLRVFPQGLDGRDPNRAARLREAYEDWLERGASVASVHRSWILHVLTDLLEYPPGLLVEGQAIPPGLEAHLPQQGETLRPDLVLRHSDLAAKAQLLITIYSPAQDLAKAVSGRPWNASPGRRMMELLHAADLPLGLVTNGEQWMLVYAPRGETTGFSSWYADLWMQEPLTLRAFHSLLHLRRLIGVAAPDTLGALLAESSKDQQEVTDQLGKQVRQAVEVLVQSLDRIDADSKRTLLTGIDEKDFYNAALTVMMRLVFLFSAEERGLLPLNDRFYEEDYSASSLRALLRARADQHGEEVLERRHDAWSRLLATFRAVHGGVRHDRLQLPAYGGSLFDPDRYPFLEGRTPGTEWRETAAKPLPINNRVVLHLLEALQELRVRVPGGGPAEKRRLSFRALDIEQIGHVYEGLLDHTARRATDVVLGLAGKNEPEVALTKLEELAKAGEEKLAEFLVEETGRSVKAISKALQGSEVDEFLQRACGNDAHLAQRLRPFAILLREDSFGQSVIIPAGCVYVTSGSDRRSTGTHYTPRSLTEPIVQHTLEPLVYVGPAEGVPVAEWKLKTPKEILALKVCDMAMGSGAFLVQVCRYLAERLVEAWANAERNHPGKVLITPDGELSEAIPSERLIPADPAERLAIARRYVADRCLYGVDINPMAVEMAKLSLWLITLQRDRPFTFLDHALKCGDSLLGVSSVQQIENFSLRPGERQVTFATANLFRYVDEASAKRRALEDLPSNDHTQIETKNRLHADAEAATAKVKAVADCLIAFELRGLDGDAYEDQRTAEAEKVQLLMKRGADASPNAQTPTLNQLSAHAREQLRGRRPLHWAVEFPEVFARGGFNAFVGNPPFLGGKRIGPTLGYDYANGLSVVFPDTSRNVDLCGYFHLRSAVLLKQSGGTYGFISTENLLAGESRRDCFERLQRVGKYFRLVESMPWPGIAAVSIAVFHFISTDKGESTSAGNAVSLSTLASNDANCFVGCAVQGMGFVLSSAEARMLCAAGEGEVVLPFLISDDINSHPEQLASREIISFGGMDLIGAENFPNALKIVQERVKPYRDTVNRKAHRERWWQYGDRRPGLYAKLASMSHVITIGITSKYCAFALLSARQVFDQTTVVIASATKAHFGLLSSSIHAHWANTHGAAMGGSPRYNPSRCYATFALPDDESVLENLGEQYFETRRKLMIARGEGFTKIYNRFHDPGETSPDIARLRALHAEMDRTVAAAYGWSDLDLGHGFHATKQGERYTLSETARRSVLENLIELNHQRCAEEIKAGLHDKGSKKGKANKARSSSGAAPQTELIPPPQQELF
jgi:hypothetical protein